jgi:hypothetical protein
MEFTIENFIWKNDGLFGEDTVLFEFDVITDEPVPYSFPCSIGLYTLLKYMAETNPELVDYIKKTRSSIDGWGPKEGRLMNELDDAVDFKTIIYDLFRSKGWFVSEYERWQKLRNMTPAEHQKIDEAAEKLSAHGPEMIRSTKDYYDFCESADKALHAIAMRIYPEILDMDKKKVKAFKYLFTDKIQDMQKILVKFTGE